MIVVKHWSLWKCLWIDILVLALISSLTGCQWQAGNGKIKRDVPDRFWQNVEKEIQEKTTVFSNDDNSYCMMAQEDGEVSLSQQRLDGTLIQNHEVNQLETVCQVTNEWIYYTTWDGEAVIRIFWRVPIQKTDRADQLIWEKKEVLLQDIQDISYITDSYVIYESGGGIYKLDLQMGKKFPVTVDGRRLDGRIAHDRNQESILLEGNLFILTETSMYCLAPDDGTVKQIYTGVEWKVEDSIYRGTYMVLCGDSICFTCDNETLWQYRAGEDQAVCVAAQELFLQKLKRFGVKKGKKFQKYCIAEILLHQERVYFLVREDSENLSQTSDAGFCLLSAPISDLSKLENESVVTEYWNSWETGAVLADSVSDDVVTQAMYVYKPNRIAGIVEGKVILEGIRLSNRGRSMVESVFCTAYDTASNQVLERSNIRKVY